MKKLQAKQQTQFQPERLTQARTSRLLNMSELADRAKLTRQVVSQYEKGVTAPSPDNVRKLADILEVSAPFFVRPLSIFEISQQTPMSYRSLASSTNKARHQARTYFEWLLFVTAELASLVSLPDVKVPELDISDFLDLTHDDIEDIAVSTRKGFGIGVGPISNLTLLLENHGVVIGRSPLSAKLDGLSAWSNGRPFILISSRANAVRFRFDLAHELAHLILHKTLNEEDFHDKKIHKIVEDQAHYFAGAFLLPESSFAAEVYGIDFNSLIQLKERWKVSIQAIIMRLHNIGLISSKQKQRLFQMLNVKNARRNEPLDKSIERESPIMFSKVLNLLASERVLDGYELKNRVGLGIETLSQLMTIPSQALEVSEAADNIVVLRR